MQDTRKPLQVTAVDRGEVMLSRLLFGVTFLLLLAFALTASAVGLKWRAWLPGAEQFTSLIGSVRAAAASAIPLMFLR